MLYLTAIFTVYFLFFSIQLTATAQNINNTPEPMPPPDAVRETFNLDPFYEQWIDVEGLPVVASDKVDPYAVKEAAWLIRQMIGHRQDILQALAQNNVRFAVMAHNELTTQIPEHSDLEPSDYWDRRARGLGSTPIRPAVSCGEENLLNYSGDPYWSENILVHEFAHAIHQMGLNTVDPGFDNRLEAMFNAAVEKGLWEGTYAITNKAEYWAEGTQSWFDTNRANDREHNHVDTRDKLKTYDPALAALLTEIYGDREWRYTQAVNRLHLSHLQGFEPDRSPTFEWPAELPTLEELNQELRNTDNDGDGAWVDLDPLDLAQLPGLKSTSSSIESEIIFVNRTGSDIFYYWVDHIGDEHFYGRVVVNTFVNQHTYASHIWLVKDPNGINLALFRAVENTGRAIIGDKGDSTSGADLERLDLAQLPGLKSSGGFVESEIIFVNRTGSDIFYYWVDYAGEERFFGRVGANTSVNQHTYTEHIWLVKDLNGVNLALFRAVAKTGQAIIGTEQPVNRADVNGDGTVNILDLVEVANSFGKESPDVNGDGVVNVLDLVAVANAFAE